MYDSNSLASREARAMQSRNYSCTDRLLTEVDHALRTVGAPARAIRTCPGDGTTDSLDASARSLAGRLMRVNHSGEIAAQALYRGQASVTGSEKLKEELLQAANEENDHLAWCAQRSAELGVQTSLLTPLWYSGAFVLGALAGLAGDRHSLGFLAETERQVAAHLEKHLAQLPAADRNSRAIVTQMRKEELDHGERANALGGNTPAAPIRHAMRLLSSVMTASAYRI